MPANCDELMTDILRAWSLWCNDVLTHEEAMESINRAIEADTEKLKEKNKI